MLNLFCQPYIEEHFYIPVSADEPKLLELKSIVRPLFKEDVSYKNTLLEDVMTNQMKKKILYDLTLEDGIKSYTINKENIYLCLKDENNKYYENNMLVYVLLHEISHTICDEVGHTKKFHLYFQELLKKAIELKVYNSDIPIIKNYCSYEN
jgi:hypothetical protein